jgi:hypothetical protein
MQLQSTTPALEKEFDLMTPNPPNGASPTVPDARQLDLVISDEVLRARVRSVLGDEREGKRSKFLIHPLTQTLWQFLLTGVVGGGIAFLIQGVADRHKRDAEVRESRRSGAEKVFRDVGAAMDRRLYWSTRYQVALASEDSAAMKGARAQLESAIADWSTTFSTNAALLCAYFGSADSRNFSMRIAPTFKLYSNLLKNRTRDPRITDAYLDTVRSHLQEAVSALNLRLVDRLRDGRATVEATGDCKIPPAFLQALPELTDSARDALDQL